MAPDKGDLAAVKKLNEGFNRIRKELGKVIVGQDRVIEELLITILARGHCLLVGVPGLAKTLMISSLARTLDLKFSRVQFTPDLMPSDITGTDIIEENKTTGARLLPIAGKVAGDRVELGGLLGAGTVMRVSNLSSAGFIARGGRIPACIRSLNN